MNQAYSIEGFAKAMNELNSTRFVIIDKESYGDNWSDLSVHIIELLKDMNYEVRVTTIQDGATIRLAE